LARTVPVMATETPGTYWTAALVNAQIRDPMNFLLGVPRFRGYAATTQSISDSTWTSLSIDTEVVDSDAGHSTVTNTSRYVCQVAGTYLLAGTSAFAANATGNRAARLAINGIAIPGSFVKTLAATVTHSSATLTTAIAPMSVGDYVEVQGYQSSGSALSTSAASDVAPSLLAVWISS
jgi:hypothetical protein